MLREAMEIPCSFQRFSLRALVWVRRREPLVRLAWLPGTAGWWSFVGSSCGGGWSGFVDIAADGRVGCGVGAWAGSKGSVDGMCSSQPSSYDAGGRLMAWLGWSEVPGVCAGDGRMFSMVLVPCYCHEPGGGSVVVSLVFSGLVPCVSSSPIPIPIPIPIPFPIPISFPIPFPFPRPFPIPIPVPFPTLVPIPIPCSSGCVILTQ